MCLPSHGNRLAGMIQNAFNEKVIIYPLPPQVCPLYIVIEMSLVLYRKYRSQTFNELVGQEHIASILRNAVSQGQISHAYLFHGPRGLGKTSTARILAKAVNCSQLQPDGNPCGKCEICVAIQEGKFLDLIEIDAASNRGIDQIRELKERIEFSPSEGRYKVYIIDEVHMLTTEAFNALLKTLEEPPKHAIMILATTEVHKIPATILSRCQRFDFRLGSESDVKLLLDSVLEKEDVKIDSKAMDLIIDNAGGSYRDALSLLDVVVSGQAKSKDPKFVTEDEVRVVLGLADSTMAYFFLEKIITAQGGEALDLIDELSQKGVNLGQFVKFVLSVLREILVGGIKENIDYEEYSFARKLNRDKTLKLINLFVEAERSLKNTVVPTLPLEVLVADAMSFFSDAEVTAVKRNAVVDDGGKDGAGNDGGKGSSGSDKKGGSGVSEGSMSGMKGSNSQVQKKDIPQASQKDKKSTLSKELSSGKSESISLSLDRLKTKWSLVLKELRPFNSHLYAFIGRSRVVELKNGVLKIAVAFDFHKDRMESAKSRDAIAKVFKKVFGVPVRLECFVDDSIRKSVSSVSDVVVIDKNEVARSSDGDIVPAEVSSNPSNIYDSVAEVFGSDLVDM